MHLIPEAIRRGWESLLKSEYERESCNPSFGRSPLSSSDVRLAHEAGVVLLAATDVDIPLGVPGLSLHEELVRLVEAGLTPLRLCRQQRAILARVLGQWPSPRAAIEAGKLADLVVLDADPLKDIRNTQRIRAVLANGRLYRRADLDRLLAEADR